MKIDIVRPRSVVSAMALVALAGVANAQLIGPSTMVEPYVLPSFPGVVTWSVVTVNDLPATNGYAMVGIPDGMGAFDNNDGTFTVLCNHELGASAGGVRAHGSVGAFVSKWTISKSTFEAVAGEDLVKQVYTYNPVMQTYTLGTTAFGRLCSGDLPAQSAFFNAATGKGTQTKIFMNGEEVGAEGRAFGHIVDGPNAGDSWELPYLGKFSWENSVAAPSAGDTTLVAGLDDSGGGQLYFYVGSKQGTGNDIVRAGLDGGDLFGLVIPGFPTEPAATIVGPVPFSLHNFGKVDQLTGVQLQTASVANLVTSFNRPEDGHWNPCNPNQFVWCTTGASGVPNRLWLMNFVDISNPQMGGTIEMVLDGTEPMVSADNLTYDRFGNVLVQEDPGSATRLAKVWQYDQAVDSLVEIVAHNPKFFDPAGLSFLTTNEESSGIIDLQDILGAGYFMSNVQAHYTLPSPLVEGGQLNVIFNPLTDLADCNKDGVTNIFDYICFGNAFSGQQPYADCDRNGSFNVFDYICFGQKYANGGC